MSTQSNNEFSPSSEKFLGDIDFKLIFVKFFDYKWLILTITMIACLIGALYALTLTPKYVSTALIQVDGQLGSANNMQQLIGNMGVPSVDKASPAEIEIALIKSRFILQSVVNKLKLNISASPNYFPIIGAPWARRYHQIDIANPLFGLSKYAWGGESIQVDTFETAGEHLGKMFQLRADGHNQFTLFLEDGTKLLSGKLGELIETTTASLPYVKIQVNKISANTGTYFNIIRKNTDDVVLELAQNLTIVDLGEKNKSKTGVLQLTYQGNNPQVLPKVLNTIIDFAIQRNIEKKSAEASKTLDFLNKQLPEVKRSLDEVETNLNEYRARSGTIDISQESKIILTQLSTLEQSIANLKLRKVEMLQEMTPEHPFVIAIGQKQLQLQREANNLAKKIRMLPHSDQRAIGLERAVKVKNQLYLLLLNSVQQLQVLKAGTLSDIRILNQATAPIIPLPTHASFTILISIFVGLFVSLVIIFIRELFHNKVINHEEIEDRLDIATFSIVPYCNKQKEINSKIKRKLFPNEYRVLAKQAPKDITSEAFRSLRTMLQFHFETTSNNIICLLGATPNIGKSFTSANLAHVLSELDKKILLIDADMRKGEIHKQVGVNKKPGFSELLTGKQNSNIVIKKIFENLDFISCGEYPNHPSELLTSEESNEILRDLSQQYDHVIIDTPPILAVTDGIILARRAATNLLVIGGGSNVMEELELTAKRAKKNGVKIHGLVFNHVKPLKHHRINYYVLQE